MNKAVFIIPYFGLFGNYFQLFLNSCGANHDFNWLILTDDTRPFEYPGNVKVVYTTFEEIKEFVQSKFDFKVSLERPYKLCDYKPSYGYIFEDYLRDYCFWGHCDTDLIWGRISDFITDDDLDAYSKIGFLGHCTLYRNTSENNRVFMRELDGHERYKKVYQNPNNCSFDEEYNHSVNSIYETYGIPYRKTEPQANTFTKTSDFRLTTYDFVANPETNTDKMSKLCYLVEKRSRNFFIWDNGILTRYICDRNGYAKKNYMYIHFQARSMSIDTDRVDVIKIIPNSFCSLEVSEINDCNIKNIKPKNFNMHYFQLRYKNLVSKLRKK